jgi:hypothetical protein
MKTWHFQKHYRDQHPGIKPNLSVKTLKDVCKEKLYGGALYSRTVKPVLNGTTNK